jgi:hypothetical protein
MITFLFLVIVILMIVLIVKLSGGKKTDDGYARGYWDGYRALGEKVSEQLARKSVDHAELQKAVNVGIYGEEEPATEQQSDVNEPVAVVTAVEQATPEDALALKHKESLRNSNMLLYMASFLLVAAGATFIGAAMPDNVKLIGIGLLTAAFYGVGLTLYRRVFNLRPAAVAFTGTGLALLPFFGIALYQYGGVDVNVAWLTTSLIGLVCYLVAAVLLQNQIVSYLTMAFLISLVSSAVATAALPIVWYFVFVIGISLIASLVAFIKPTWLPKVFSEPVERTGQVVTPLALIASLFVDNKLSLQGYEIVFATGTAHYLVAWLQSRQAWQENFVRGLGHIVLLITAWDLADDSMMHFGVYFLALATLQLALSFLSQLWSERRRTSNAVWAAVAIGLQFVAPLFWVTNSIAADLNLIAFGLIGISGVAVYYVFRNVLFLVPTLIASVALPFIFGRSIADPQISWEWLGVLFVIFATVILYSYKLLAKRHTAQVGYFLIVSFVLYILVVLGLGATIAITGTTLAEMLIVGLVALLVFTSSWIYRQPWVIALAAVIGVFAISSYWTLIGGDQKWWLLAVAWIAGAIYYFGSWVFLLAEDNKRHQVMLISGLSVLGLGVFVGNAYADHALAIGAGWTIVAIGAILALEGDRRKYYNLVEIGVYVATFGLQYITFIDHPDTSLWVYGHWWAIIIAVAGFMRHQTYPRLMIALGFVTASSGIDALGKSGGYSLFFLIEHIVVLVAGVVRSRSWAIWWGIIASSLAVLYFIRDIAYLAFGFLGLLLVGFVIWRLTRPAHLPPVDKSSD